MNNGKQRCGPQADLIKTMSTNNPPITNPWIDGEGMEKQKNIQVIKSGI